MPIRGVLDLQRRSVQIGEIRLGTSVAIEGKAGRRPVRLETFRFTTASEQAAKAVAGLYGGEVAPWAQKKGRWEVITDRTAIDVWVPPRGEAVDANMELWDGPKCLRRCDGTTMSLPAGKPCMCPQAKDPSDPDSVLAARDERIRLAGLRPPQACKPLTRINVTIPDLPGLLGVWRLNTGSVNAAVETADSGEAMDIAREGGVYLPAVLRIEWRVRSADGKPYPVPVLQIGLSMREIAEGALPAGPSGLLAQLQGAGTGQHKAITAGTEPAPDVPRPGYATPQTSGSCAADGQPLTRDLVADGGPGHHDEPPDDDEALYRVAQGIADRLAVAQTAEEFKALGRETDEAGCGEVFVCVDRAGDMHEQLRDYGLRLWDEKAKEAAR